MKFKDLCEKFEKLEKTMSRNEMAEIIANCILEYNLDDAVVFSYLLEGRIAPQFVPIEFNFSEKGLINSYKNDANIKGVDFESLRKEKGDIGEVFYEVWKDKKKINFMTEFDEKLSIQDVYKYLWKIAKTEGNGAVAIKTLIFKEISEKLSAIEIKYLSKIIAGKLRLGVNIKTVLDAVSIIISGDKSAREKIDVFYGFNCDIASVIRVAKDLQAKEIDERKRIFNEMNFAPIPGIPFFPKLVQRVLGFEEIFERMPNGFFIQPKYDGLRTQIHKYDKKSLEDEKELIWFDYFNDKLLVGKENLNGGLFEQLEERKEENVIVKIFSRNLEDITEMFPEIVADLKKEDANNFILDGEIVGIEKEYSVKNPDFNDGKISEEKYKYKFVPFQETMTRKRKYDIGNKVNDLPVKFFLFDILFFEGHNYSNKPIIERGKLVSDIKNKLSSSKIDFAETIFCNRPEELKKSFDFFTKYGLEGIIVKDPKSLYTPAVRNYDWIKLKKSMEKKLVDTLDLVVIGYYYGSGKRTNFGMGALLMAVYDQGKNVFVPFSKLGTGITDKQWGLIKQTLANLEIKNPSKSVDLDGVWERADVWIEPKIVAVVEADEISKSKIYNVGKDKLGYGLGLRFPRLVQFGRDKSPEDATSVQELVDIMK